MTSLSSWLWVALGGALGAVCRVGVAQLMIARFDKGFLGTLCANLVGCALMGVLKAMVEHHALGSEAMRTFLLGGFVGAFTTFSTFMADGASLWREGRAVGSAIYLSGSVLGGGVCFLLGWYLCSRALLSSGGAP